MSKTSIGLFCVVALYAAGAGAVIDPAPDRVSIYFDWNADLASVFVGPSTPFFAYVILTNPSSAEIWGFEFGYTVTPSRAPAQVFRLFSSLPDLAVDLGTNVDPLAGDYVVGLAEPLPGAPAVVLVTWQYMILAPMTLEMQIGPSAVESIPDGLPAYEAGGTIVPLGLAVACMAPGEALVNTECGLAVEATAFGAIKTLYR